MKNLIIMLYKKKGKCLNLMRLKICLCVICLLLCVFFSESVLESEDNVRGAARGTRYDQRGEGRPLSGFLTR